MPIFIKWIAKNDAKRRRMLKLREFSHNHHPSRVKILAENIRRGISVIYSYDNNPIGQSALSLDIQRWRIFS
jgi:hypothetical protein